MYICYVDESGDPGRFIKDNKDAQPAFMLLGLILPQSTLRDYTRSFISLKQQYFPEKCRGNIHDAILCELKGSDLRSVYTKSNSRRIRHATAFFQDLISLINSHAGKIIGRVYVKSLDDSQNSSPAGIYTFSMQAICEHFQNFLAVKNACGIVLCDSRDFNQNHQSSHAIFTQMYKKAGDAYPNIVDMPTFGDSRNHAGIQTVDILCSGLLYPMTMHTYCIGYGLKNKHVQPKYEAIRELFHGKLGQMQFRYDGSLSNKTSTRAGGVVVSDSMGKKPGHLLFGKPQTMERKLSQLMAKFNG